MGVGTAAALIQLHRAGGNIWKGRVMKCETGFIWNQHYCCGVSEVTRKQNRPWLEVTGSN